MQQKIYTIFTYLEHQNLEICKLLTLMPESRDSITSEIASGSGDPGIKNATSASQTFSDCSTLKLD